MYIWVASKWVGTHIGPNIGCWLNANFSPMWGKKDIKQNIAILLKKYTMQQLLTE